MEPVDSQRDIMRIGKNFVVKAKPVRNLVTGEVVKNDSCALEILRASDGQAFSKVDIELSCLPSQSLSAAYGIVYLTNFKVSAVERTALEVTILEQVAFDAIKKFYHESVSVLTTPTWFDALDNKVGLSSLMAFAKRFNLKLNTKVGTMIRESVRSSRRYKRVRPTEDVIICTANEISSAERNAADPQRKPVRCSGSTMATTHPSETAGQGTKKRWFRSPPHSHPSTSEPSVVPRDTNSVHE